MYTKYKPVVNMGANHSHVTIYMVQSMAPKASFSTLCAHNDTLVHVPSKKFLHKIIGQDGQDLAQDLGQDLRQDPGQDYGSQSWHLGQDLGQVLGKLGQVLGKISCPRTFCWELIVYPQWLSTLCAHNGNASLCAHNGCPRCAPTMAVHVVRPQWRPCPRCAWRPCHVVRQPSSS